MAERKITYCDHLKDSIVGADRAVEIGDNHIVVLCRQCTAALEGQILQKLWDRFAEKAGKAWVDGMKRHVDGPH